MVTGTVARGGAFSPELATVDRGDGSCDLLPQFKPIFLDLSRKETYIYLLSGFFMISDLITHSTKCGW